MSHFQPQPALVSATVQEVLPRSGLAFAIDAEQREWTLTKSTPGESLATLEVGETLLLSLERHDSDLWVCEYHRSPLRPRA